MSAIIANAKHAHVRINFVPRCRVLVRLEPFQMRFVLGQRDKRSGVSAAFSRQCRVEAVYKKKETVSSAFLYAQFR